MKTVSHTQGYGTAIKWLFENARHHTSVKVGQKVAGNELLIK